VPYGIDEVVLIMMGLQYHRIGQLALPMSIDVEMTIMINNSSVQKWDRLLI
jgi:hypothetical protein